MVRREKLGRKDTYMYQTRKIGVVGQGHVGAHVANSLLMQGIADELYLCDINEAKVTSEVQDLRDSLSFVPYNTKIVNCYDHYEELACCDVIVNAAGKVALAAGNRDGELFFTTDAARTFAKRIVDAGFDGIFVSISNPCDVVCTELWHLTGYDPALEDQHHDDQRHRHDDTGGHLGTERGVELGSTGELRQQHRGRFHLRVVDHRDGDEELVPQPKR